MSLPLVSNIVDLEGQTVLPETAPVLTCVTRAPPTYFTPTPVEDFFGYTLSSSRTHESRHDQSTTDILPPYVDDLPPYTRNAPEPTTLAMYLFKFGFLFPPFWIMGAIILMSPLRAPDSSETVAWMPEKTESERQQIIAQMRKVEVKWAYRCVWALVILIILVSAAVIAAWAIIRA
ncbi:hypothetical protein BDZ94DRAFT_1157674 [Collybia nuda]|uniref:Transmembrane protein n=1 Tax=Collybia nuda TaxID=64659 RepID=A0A9P6CN07_9AGAR|nr:hypothetical protein BDZ94DRAFT_1157674 [Collybia nuda]